LFVFYAADIPAICEGAHTTAWGRPQLGSPLMPQHDRLIPENARCSHCSGSGWTPWSAAEEPGGSKWVVCRECLGTGRTDKKGRKRIKPEDSAEG